jgi:hypothetical protein
MTLIAFMHVLRPLFALEVTLNGNTIPMWVSVAGIVLAGLLVLMLWREKPAAAGLKCRLIECCD